MALAVTVPPRPPGQRRRALSPPVRAMIADLSADYGQAFASEAGYRRELFRRTGYVCGERSIGRVIARLVARGEVGHKRIKPNQAFVHGVTTNHGGQQNWIIARRAQRKARRRAAEQERQAERQAARDQRERLEREQRRREAQARERAELQESRKAAATALPMLVSDKPFTLAPIREDLARHLEEQRRTELDRQTSAARELAAQWEREDKRGRPPDE